MAIYHLHAKVIQRSKGQNIIAASAYRRAAKLYDNKEERSWDFTAKRDVMYTEVLVPENAPAWIKEVVALHAKNPSQAAEQLWNALDAAEKRKDAQLGREIEFALPIELTPAQNIHLAREFIRDHMVSRGMIADWSVHWDKGNPHVHVLLTMRSLTDVGFGQRMLEWNQKALLHTWREQWADYANFHLHLHHHAVKIDHRSYEEQGIDLQPGIHQGKAAQAMAARGQSLDRLEEANVFSRLNLARLSENAEIVFRQLSSLGDTFTDDDLAKVLGRYVAHQGGSFSQHRPNADQNRFFTLDHQKTKNALEGAVENAAVLTAEVIEKILQVIATHESVFSEKDILKAVAPFIANADVFAKAVLEIKQSKTIIALGAGEDGRDRFTTRQLFETENTIQQLADKLGTRWHIHVSERQKEAILAEYEGKTGKSLTEEQKTAVAHLLKPRRIACIVGRAGTGKSFSLGAAKSLWESQHLAVYGIALSGIAADGLRKDVGISSTTIASFCYRVEKQLLTLKPHDVIVMDEAGMTDSLSMLSVLKIIDQAQAKLVLVGDPAQLQPVGPGASFRALVERLGFAEIQTVYRQTVPWQREATVDFSNGDIEKGLAAYRAKNAIHFDAKPEKAMRQLRRDWQKVCVDPSDLNRVLVIAHRNTDVAALNTLLRASKIEEGKLSEGYAVKTTQGEINIASGDRVLFLKNDRTLGVSNGRFATIDAIELSESGHVSQFTVKLDGNHELVTINPYTYKDFTYGYAATVHKIQGATVEKSFVYVGGKGWNRHLTYVALTRHRYDCQVYADRETHANEAIFTRRLSRLGVKDSVLDFPLAFAQRRGIDAQKFSQTLSVHLAKRLARWKTQFTEQWDRWINPHRVLERETIRTREQQKTEQTVQRREDAKVVASYVDAHREVGITWQALQAKLKHAPKMAVVKETEAYSAFETARKLRDQTAYTILHDRKRYEKALQLYGIPQKPLERQANRYCRDRYRAENEKSKQAKQDVFSAKTGDRGYPRYPKIDMKRLRAALNDRADSVATHYLGQPKHRQGLTWRYGRNQGSLVVTVQGAKQGLWHDFQLDRGGDMFSLIQHTLATHDFKAILHEATRFLGGDSLYQMSSETKSAVSPSKNADVEAHTQQKIRKAQAIYAGTQSITGTLAARYLREHRGILPEINDHTFRYHPNLRNWMTGSVHPAFIVVARDENDQVCGLQAIFLDEKTGKKAAHLGHYVKLSRGLIGEGALVQRGKPGGKIALAEGPETALSIAQAQPDWRVYVTFGVGNFAKVRLPDQTSRVLICADNDGQDSDTAKSIARSAEKLAQRGINVEIAEPQKPRNKTQWDFNDALLAGGIEEVKQDLDRAKAYQKGVSKEHTDEDMNQTKNLEKTLTVIDEPRVALKKPFVGETASLVKLPNDSIPDQLLRYVDMELEQTRLVTAMHTARVADPETAKSFSAQALANSNAMQIFAEAIAEHPDIKKCLEMNQGVKPPRLSECGGFVKIRERLQQGEYSKDDIHLLAVQLRNKVVSESMVQMRERSREGRSR